MRTVSLGELIKPAKNVRAGQDTYPVLSMTMHEGLVPQEGRFKKTIASQDLSTYKVVARSQLVVGFPIDEGVLDFQTITDAGIVSPAYGIWDVNNSEIVDISYLGRFLRSPQALSYYKAKLRGTTARRRSLPRAVFEEMPVPLPPIDEQQRIARILDQASAAFDACGQEINLLRNFRNDSFERLFPASEFPATKIGDYLATTQYGSSSKAQDQGSMPILRMGNLTNEGSLTLDDLKYIDLLDKDLDRYTLQDGDILFNRTNSKELVGKTALYRGESNTTAYAGYLVRCRVNEDSVPEFIVGYLNSRRGKALLRLRAKAIVGMANINATELKKLPIPAVPLEAQQQYAELFQKCELQIIRLKKKQELLTELHHSLQTRAFQGLL